MTVKDKYFDRPNPLHVLLLVFVKCGLATTYDLKSEAGMSVGLTGTALRRLESAGLLISRPGPRKSVRYLITEKGEEELRGELKSGRMRHWWLGKFAIFESVPRAMFFAWLYSDSENPFDCLDWAVQELRALARKKEREAQEVRDAMLRLRANSSQVETADEESLLIATVYRWMKTESDAALLKMQAEALETMVAPRLSDLPPAPKPKLEPS